MELNMWDSALDTMKNAVNSYADEVDFLVLQANRTSWVGGGQAATIAEQDLLHVNSRLAVLLGIEKQLRVLRVRLHGIRNRSVTLSAIAGIPSDLLRMIVIVGHEDRKSAKMTCDDIQDFRLLGEPQPSLEPAGPHFPTVFSHVCRRWREVALDTATVWASLDFRYSRSFERSAEWLKRGKQANLSFALSTRGGQDMLCFERALKRIGPNISRATSLDLNIHKQDCILQLAKRLAAYNQLPPLKSLQLSVSGHIRISEHDLGDHHQEILTNIMRGVQHASLQVLLPLGSGAYQALKCLRLARLTVSTQSNAFARDLELLEVLQGCSKLESLSLETIRLEPRGYKYGTGLVQRPVTVLRNLRNFSLHRVDSQLVCLVLSALVPPALEGFNLSGCGIPSGDNLPEVLLAFFKGLPPTSLRSLGIHDNGLSGTSNLRLDRIIAHTPALEQMYVGDLCPGYHFLATLSRSEQLVPKLERLWLKGGTFYATDLRNFVCKRNDPKGDKPIKKLVVASCRVEGMQPSILRDLQDRVADLLWADFRRPLY